MKKINLLIGALLLSLAALSYTALVGSAVKAEAQNLTCIDMSNCCGSAGCNTPGTVSGCSLTCDGGGSVTCEKKVGGKCGSGGGDPVDLPADGGGS